MRIFTLAKSELKKIFLKPIVLITFFVIIATLVVTTFTFSPTSKERTTVSLGGTNIQTTYNTFMESNSNPNSKLNLDEKLKKTYLWVSNYYQNIKSEEQLQTLKQKIATTDSYMQQVHNAVLSYYNDNGQNQTEVKEKFQKLATHASETYNYINNLENITFYLSIQDFNTLSDFFEGIAKNIPQNFANPDRQFSQINNFLSEYYNFDQISDITKNLKVFDIDDEQYDLYIKTFYTEIYSTNPDSKLSVLQNKIDLFVNENSLSTLPEDFETFNTLVSNYKSIITMSSNALQNAWTTQIAGTKSDNELHNYIGFTNYNSYIYKNEVVKNQYLLNNNKFDYEYLSPMSFNSNSGETTNVFDFTVFAMQISCFILAIVVIFVSSGTVATELANGTMKMLAIRPYSRKKIIISKFLACTAFMTIILFMVFAISFAVGYFTYGISATNVLIVFDATTAIELNVFVVLLLYFASCMINLIFYISLSILISILFKSNVISVIVGLLTYGMSIISNALLYTKNWMIYLPFAHFDLFKYFGSTINSGGFFGFSIANGSTFATSCIYLIACILLYIILSIFIFKKRNIA